MKKNSKTRVLDYDRTYEGNFDYYGLFSHNGGNGIAYKVDSKRIEKKFPVEIDDVKLLVMGRRRTKYFFPNVNKRYDYAVNLYRDVVKSLKEEWKNEYYPLLKKIETPEQREIELRNYYLMYGYDHDEASEKGFMSSLTRHSEYKKVLKGIRIQFIQKVGATIEGLTYKIFSKKGIYYHNRKSMRGQYELITKKDFEKIHYYSNHDRLYTLWNFIKHNSLDTFKKVKKKFPELLLSEEVNFEGYGYFAETCLKIDDDLMINLLDGLIPFFEQYCSEVFGESIEESKWNYSDWFFHLVNNYLDEWDEYF